MQSMKYGMDHVVGKLLPFCIALAAVVWMAVIISLIVSVTRDASSGYVLASSKDLLAPAVAATGVLIAVLAFARDKGKIERDRSDARSKILYEQAKEGLDVTFELLKDLNNDRITWIRAARVLQRSIDLGGGIDSPEYKHAYQLAEEATRHRMWDLLQLGTTEGERHDLPAAFFYGLNDWKNNKMNLDDVAKATSSYARVMSVPMGGNVPEPLYKPLDPRSVKVVMGFLKYPRDYICPIQMVDWRDLTGWSDSHGPEQGAAKYLEHRMKKRATFGKLYDIPRT